MAKDILRNRYVSVKSAKENNMECIVRSEFIFSFAGKTELSCKIIDADDEWIKICYTEKKDK